MALWAERFIIPRELEGWMDRKFLLSLCILALALGCATPEPEEPADLIVQNGGIYTFG